LGFPINATVIVLLEADVSMAAVRGD
jgi:hypothetical protein